MSRFAFIAALSCAAPAFADTAYFAAIPDLPVAPGMSETADLLGAMFAGASGELILATAHGAAAPDVVERFYGESLSALGWAYTPGPREEGLMFMRGRERLILHIEPRGGGTYLRVRLIARPAPTNAD
jgi:hypothetical protein